MSSNGDRGSRGNGAGGGGAASAAGSGPIPESARKLVQRLKEIVSYYSDQEIYAALKECNMDPDDAISRLLNQDTFHEVKSKRDKKKEIKDASESKPRGVSSAHRGSRVDRSVTRLNSSNTTSSDYGTSGKHSVRKDNGPPLQSSILGSGNTVNAIGRRSSAISSPSVDATINGPSAASPAASQTSGFQQPWLGVPGQPSMADIVKMGRPRSRSSALPAVATEAPIPQRAQNAAAGNTFAVIEKPDAISEHISHDGWSDQLPDVNRMSAAESSGNLTVLHDTSTLLTVDNKSHTLQTSELESALSREGNMDDEGLLADAVRSVPTGNQQVPGDSPEEASNIDDSSFRNFSYYESQQPVFDEHNADDDADISSMASTLQQLQLPKEEVGRKHSEQSRTVIFADHLQITSADCSHLSFGSFGTGLSANFSTSVASESFQESPEVISAAEETSPSDHLDDRKPEYYNDEQLMPIPVEDEAPQAPSTSLGYDQPSCSEPEPSGPDPSDPLRGMQQHFPSSLSSYQFSDSTQPSPSAHNYPEANSQVQSHVPSPNTPMAHTNSLPRHLVESAQPVQEFDLPYQHLFASQSLATRYTAAPSVSGSSVSLPEAVNPSLFSMPKETLQALSGSNVLPGPSVAQNISIQQHTQPSHPLGQYANVINYPFFPQNFSYMPSTLQQTYAGLGTGMGAYHQLQEAAAHNASLKYSLPEYKNLHVNNLQQPAAITTAPPNVAAAYVDALGSQFKESIPYSAVQLNENPALWPQASSRTLSTMQANYFNLLSQTQQSSFRQTQQPSMYGGLGYPNIYHSQAVPQERQQNPGHMSLNGLQGIPSQPSHGSHQLWQSSYRSP